MRQYIMLFGCILLSLGLFFSACTNTAGISGTVNQSENESNPGTATAPSHDIVYNTGDNVYTEPAESYSRFKIVIEAEDAELSGGVRIENIKSDFSGTGYVTGIENPSDSVSFKVEIPVSGTYDLNFISASYSGYKENNVLLDGEFIGAAKIENTRFDDSILKKVFINEGEHEIKMTKNWGWIYLDRLEVTASEPANPSLYNVTGIPVDPKATERTKKLMRYLADIYGKYIISGQYGDRGIKGAEFKAINQLTGKYPAMLGLDFIDYTPSRRAHGAVGRDVEYAIEFDSHGGIVTFCWHWNAPEPYLYNTTENPWWSGFYTKATNIDLETIMSGDDPEGYELIIRDIDAIAHQLKRLQDADIPVLFRPLHEASGGWFWWGASGHEPYIKLYKLLFERLTDYHQIHNLIWVWNGQDKDWYPGDEYVDIAGVDIYPGERVYSPQTPKFYELAEWAPGKMLALTENGCLFDPDLAFRDNAIWSYFGTWEGEFVTLNKTYTLSEKYTEKEVVKKVYTHEKVITLDELPDLKTYGD